MSFDDLNSTSSRDDVIEPVLDGIEAYHSRDDTAWNCLDHVWMPLVAYHLGMVLPGRALMSFGCHSMVSMHLGGLLSWLVFPPNCLGFFLMMTQVT